METEKRFGIKKKRHEKTQSGRVFGKTINGTSVSAYCIKVWLLNFLFFFWKKNNKYLNSTMHLRARKRSLVSVHATLAHSCPASFLRESKTDKKNTMSRKRNVQSNVHHIFKHISKSSDFEIISQNKFYFFLNPFCLYRDCTIYSMYILIIMREQSNKNKYFFSMSPFKEVYLCTFIPVSIFLLAYCECMWSPSRYCAQCVVFFPLCRSRR